ncbi:MAG: hypothetical protein KGH88_04750 [Thaumarchaeota archaeon]|nr:hypothetical protein [Nitrososphaerota archaeon]
MGRLGCIIRERPTVSKFDISVSSMRSMFDFNRHFDNRKTTWIRHGALFCTLLFGSFMITPALADNNLAFTSSNSTSAYNTPDSTATKVTSNPETSTSGNAFDVTASVTDISNPSSSIIGIISWSDGGAGGIFNPNNCIATSGKCTVTYTLPSSSTGSITITASYAGDSSHSNSSGTASLSAISSSTQSTQTQSMQANPNTSPNTSTTQTTPDTSATQSSPSTPTNTQPTKASPNTPEAQSPSTTSPSVPTPLIHQVINIPQEIFDKAIGMLEKIFQKIT